MKLTPTGIIRRLGTFAIAGYGWWQFNIVFGNALAVEALGIFAFLPDWGRQVVVPISGSLTQLYWEEDLDTGVLSHPLVAAFCIIIGIADTLGPGYGFMLMQQYEFTMSYMVLALLWGIFFSIICQYVAWNAAKELLAWAWAWAKSQIVRRKRARRRPRATA